MEPGILISLIGAVLSYISGGRASGERADIADFLNYLDEHNLEDTHEIIQSNQELKTALGNLLRNNHEEMLEKLRGLEASLATLVSAVDGLRDIPVALSPALVLSEQAISILKQLDQSGGNGFLEVKDFSGSTYHIMGGSDIKIDDPRFIDDDLNKLSALGLLIESRNPSDRRLFKLTRNAAKLVERIDNQQKYI